MVALSSSRLLMGFRKSQVFVQRSFTSTLPRLIATNDRETSSRPGNGNKEASNDRTGSPHLMIPASIIHELDFHKLVRVSRSGTEIKDGLEMEAEELARDKRRSYLFSLYDNKFIKVNPNNLRFQWQRYTILPCFGEVGEELCIGSSHGWLAFVNRSNCALYLFDPFVSSNDDNIRSKGNTYWPPPFIPLPPIETLPHIISRSIHLTNIENGTGDCPRLVTEFVYALKEVPVSSEKASKEIVSKVVLSAAPSASRPLSSVTVAAILGGSRRSRRLAFCRIGDKGWTCFDGAYGHDDYDVYCGYIDVLYFTKDRRFYALSRNGELDAWDLSDPTTPRCTRVKMTFPPIIHKSMDRKARDLRIDYEGLNDRYLVESSEGDLLMVVNLFFPADGDEDEYGSYQCKTRLYDVFKLDFTTNKWVFVPSLGDDTVLFLGSKSHGYAFSRSAHGSPLGQILKGDSIFSSIGIYADDACVYDHRDKTSSSFYLHECKSRKVPPPPAPSPVWVIPNNRA